MKRARNAALVVAGAVAAVGLGVVSKSEPCVARHEQTRPLGCYALLPDGGPVDVYPASIRASEAHGDECFPAECAP